MSKRYRIKVRKGWIAYPGSTLQQNYGESLNHGYLLWSVNDRDRFDVKFKELPNPQPFVTVEWLSNVKETFDVAAKSPRASRFRIVSTVPISQRDMVELTTILKNRLAASEVTFKIDHVADRDVIVSGAMTVVRDDLHNSDVIMRLLREYHSNVDIDEATWERVNEQVTEYASRCISDDSAKNSKWSLKHLKFDNTFAYGEGNVIDFSKLSGVVGIFGPNRSGKSSIVGTIMYSLFNDTDRGSMKNLHVINARKPHCYSRAVVDVNGTDYVIERQTVKHESKRVVWASTALNVFKMVDGEAMDLAGEQRNDTEKVIRSLIGIGSDFQLTSLSSQDDLKAFISQGASRRHQLISRFLDLDVFDRMHELAKADMNVSKAALRHLPERDWTSIDNQALLLISNSDQRISEIETQLLNLNEKLSSARHALLQHGTFNAVTQTSIDVQASVVSSLRAKVNDLTTQIDAGAAVIASQEKSIDGLEKVLATHDLEEKKLQLSRIKDLEVSLVSLQHDYDRESTSLKTHEKSLKLLNEVPCGDSFPTCKFIKDAFKAKDKLPGQLERSNRAYELLLKSQSLLSSIVDPNLKDQIDKLQKMTKKLLDCRVERSSAKTRLENLTAAKEAAVQQLAAEEGRLSSLEEAFRNEENIEVVATRKEIDSIVTLIRSLDSERMQKATQRGSAQTTLDKNLQERSDRNSILTTLRVHDLIATAFSRKAIPSLVIASQLPIINSELNKILHGIVDFTVELQLDDSGDSIDVYINYGDSRRIIELGSGMEKMVSSIAIRVAMINVSTLPKTDMLLIDEGFGALDDLGVEACNRLLTSLKRYFRLIVVITHVDGVKDVADHVIELAKTEKDSCVIYE